MGIGRKHPKQGVERLAAPVHRQREVVVHEQARSRCPLTGCLIVADRLDDATPLFVPGGRGVVQRRDRRRRDAPQFEAQQIGEQVVVAEPRTGGVERGDERVLVFEPLEDRLGPDGAGEHIGERAADARKNRRAQEQVAHLRRLSLQHLGEEVARHGPLAARELGHKALRVRVRGQRDRRQAQTGRPSLGAFLQRVEPGIRQRDSAGAQQGAGFVEREAQVGPAQFGQLAREPQAVQAERRLLACREHDPQPCRQPPEQHLQPLERVAGVKLVQVVDHQRERLLEPLELRQESLQHHRACELRRRADPLDDLIAGRIGDRADHVKPEPLRITLAALDRDPGDGRVRLRGPRAQQNALPASGRGTDEGHAARSGR